MFIAHDALTRAHTHNSPYLRFYCARLIAISLRLCKLIEHENQKMRKKCRKFLSVHLCWTEIQPTLTDCRRTLALFVHQINTIAVAARRKNRAHQFRSFHFSLSSPLRLYSCRAHTKTKQKKEDMRGNWFSTRRNYNVKCATDIDAKFSKLIIHFIKFDYFLFSFLKFSINSIHAKSSRRMVN